MSQTIELHGWKTVADIVRKFDIPHLVQGVVDRMTSNDYAEAERQLEKRYEEWQAYYQNYLARVNMLHRLGRDEKIERRRRTARRKMVNRNR